ncbi:hypothetical protein BN1095_2640001 [Clostridioides difficile]|uniref:Uncharacterized protein n=1 Tax=Clostridioides difficile TaxID=1496 RepID=A0A069ALW3_CLODI|nr:hypothetical protein BN1095_2640001 [Clostridioides difficile]
MPACAQGENAFHGRRDGAGGVLWQRVFQVFPPFCRIGWQDGTIRRRGRRPVGRYGFQVLRLPPCPCRCLRF